MSARTGRHRPAVPRVPASRPLDLGHRGIGVHPYPQLLAAGQQRVRERAEAATQVPAAVAHLRRTGWPAARPAPGADLRRSRWRTAPAAAASVGRTGTGGPARASSAGPDRVQVAYPPGQLDSARRGPGRCGSTCFHDVPGPLGAFPQPPPLLRRLLAHRRGDPGGELDSGRARGVEAVPSWNRCRTIGSSSTGSRWSSRSPPVAANRSAKTWGRVSRLGPVSKWKTPRGSAGVPAELAADDVGLLVDGDPVPGRGQPRAGQGRRPRRRSPRRRSSPPSRWTARPFHGDPAASAARPDDQPAEARRPTPDGPGVRQRPPTGRPGGHHPAGDSEQIRRAATGDPTGENRDGTAARRATISVATTAAAGAGEPNEAHNDLPYPSARSGQDRTSGRSRARSRRRARSGRRRA